MIALFTLAVALPQDGPSFDCARATTAVEQAICADPRLAAQDRQAGAAYARVRRSLSPAARAALVRDQRWYLEARDEGFAMFGDLRSLPGLATRMRERTDFLTSLLTERPDTLIGHWRNVAGYVDITPAVSGRLAVEAQAAQPRSGNWVCDIAVEGPQAGQTVEGVSSYDPPYRIRAMLKDGYLEIEEEALTPGSYGPPYCGANGHISGVYFRVR